jgi:hypothetical protein
MVRTLSAADPGAQGTTSDTTRWPGPTAFRDFGTELPGLISAGSDIEKAAGEARVAHASILAIGGRTSTTRII